MNTIARVEESLHSMSFERYEDLFSAVDRVLNAETQTNEHSSSERQAVSDESIANVAADPHVTPAAAMTIMTPRERVVAFIDQHLRLDRDRKDRRYFIRIRALHGYYTKVSRDRTSASRRVQCSHQGAPCRELERRIIVQGSLLQGYRVLVVVELRRLEHD